MPALSAISPIRYALPMCHSLHCLCDISEAARTFRIAHLTGAPPGVDMRPHPFRRVRSAGLLDFGSDLRFVFSEAVTDRARTGWLFLPDRNPEIRRRECPARCIEIHDVARRIGTESMRAGF